MPDTNSNSDSDNNTCRQNNVKTRNIMGLKQADLTGKIRSVNKSNKSNRKRISANSLSANKQIDIRKFYSFKPRDSQAIQNSERGKVGQGVRDNLHKEKGNN